MGSVVDGALVGSPYQAWERFLRGRLQLGRLLETDLSTDVRVERQAWQKATEAHADFWRRWAAWRHAPAGAPGGSFHDILRLFRLEEQLVAYMGIQPGDLVVDLGCGGAWLAQFLPPAAVDYLGVEGNSWAVREARAELAQLQLSGRQFRGRIVEHNLMAGLPQEVARTMMEARARRIRVVARWSLYFPMPTIVKIVEQVFGAGVCDLTVDHMTAGKFQPLGLMAHFLPFLAVGWAKRRLTGRQVFRALKALGKMIPYGVEFKKLFPLWSVDQLTAALAELNCRVEALDRPLWGQTTFLRVLPRR